MIAKYLIISGRVQGVGYRNWMVKRASQAGIHGWVRNRADGTVEAVVHGTSDGIEQLIKDARKGPPAARVADITITDAAYDGPDIFDFRETA